MTNAQAPATQPTAVPLNEIESELARQLKIVHGGGEAPVQTAHMSNLIVFCNKFDLGERIAEQIPAVAALHPSRVLLLMGEQDPGENDVSASVQVRTQPAEGRHLVCWEQVTVKARGSAVDRLPFTVRELLIGDLPTNLWWAAAVPPPLAGQFLYDLTEHVQQIIYDSQGWTEPARGVAATASWLVKFERGPMEGQFRVASDLSWRRLRYWRRIIAQALDPGTAPGAAQSISEILIEHGPHAVTQAWQLVSWLASRLNWQVQAGNVEPNVEISWRAAAPKGGLRIRIQRLAESPPEIRRVRIAHAASGKPEAFSIWVHDGRRLAMCPEEGQHSMRTMTIQPQSVPEMVGRQLSDREPDPIFRETMAVAQIFAQGLLS
jgi:glucose-6-phosphate dehydrogenase assembly protein OpcA